jgi:1,2-phenylacetyl-CoA epoxidase catalytic subunit
MAIFSVEIADEDVERVINAVASNYNYQDQIITENNRMIDNPESKYVFANRMVRKFLSDHVKKYELELAKKTLEEQLASVTINDPAI